ncbi:MBOAT family protein [Akkermansiaceae bacterium]|nr:MBOAT family protein [Akkermansiaceae bacterium]MDA7887886.1 MBOAT family protein [Akkermansiaceae bacterium]
MIFNSLEFVAFFIAVFWGYFGVRAKYRWMLLLIASYIFYASWNPLYTLLIVGSTLVDYFAAIQVEKSRTKRAKKLYLTVSLLSNLGLLGFFKYYGFLAAETNWLLDAIGLSERVPIFQILLPVGISFYTFQTMSYSIDVYRGSLKAERHLGYFALYVSFFPQLVAGPIERSTRLLPQLRNLRGFDYQRVREGFQLIYWGLFKKIVVADWLADYVNSVYGNTGESAGLACLLATFFFGFQIYYDFSAYSEIARGCGKIFGVELMVNFRTPYFARSIKEFWNRWHISLSTWFRDYIYFPLGGSRVAFPRVIMNILIVFAISGIWHGANWTFLIWGLLHGAALALLMATSGFRNSVFLKIGLSESSLIRQGAGMILTFLFVSLTWVFFRADNLADAIEVLSKFGSLLPISLGSGQIAAGLSRGTFLFLFVGIFIVTVLEARGLVFKIFSSSCVYHRWGLYTFLGVLMITSGHYQPSEFVYFQF